MFTGMKKRLRYVFFIAAFTAVASLSASFIGFILIIKQPGANFMQTATVSLWQSIDSCMLAQNALPSSLDEEKPSLTFMMTKSANLSSKARDSSHRPADTTYSVRLFTVNMDGYQAAGVKTLLARLFSQQGPKAA